MCLGCHHISAKMQRMQPRIYIYVCEVSLEMLTRKWIGKLPLRRTGEGLENGVWGKERVVVVVVVVVFFAAPGGFRGILVPNLE